MKKFSKKIAALLATTLIIGTSSVVVNAENQTLTSPGQAEVNLTANISSTFSVTAPSECTINNNATTTFNITASGNIAGNEVLKIECPESVNMEQEGKESVTATIELSKTEFNATDLNKDGGDSSEVAISVSGLSAGEWVSTVSFVITLEEIQPETP